jgi:putative FmdB family regulatory protein
MPLFEYRCADCDARFERLTRREQADAATCPECGSTQSRRLLSVFATFSPSAGDGPVLPTASSGGGCGCGGSCSCGGH